MANSWDEVFNRVRLSRAPEEVWPSVPEAELNAAEAELGVPLPASYRAFALQFGMGGEFWGMYRMKSLFERDQKHQDVTVSGWTRLMQSIVNDYGANMSLSQEQLRHFVFFGDDCGRGHFAWDAGNPTATNPVEYPVYFYPQSDNHVERLANTFAEFVQWVDADARRWNDDTRAVEHIRWEPYHTREKDAPLESDTNLWLAFNNSTARQIARSIRDAGHTDAFPILADALQEAGCTNADLLDSCRTGDPDIDGVWVLQVLLGKA